MIEQTLFTYDYIEENEQAEFLTILYHSAQGVKIRMSLDSEKRYPKNYSNYEHQKIQTLDSQRNVYTSLNTFRHYNRRLSNETFAYTGIFLDLDCHGVEDSSVSKRIFKTQKYLEKLYRTEELVRPTMITNTGRGLGIYYILRSTIANTEAAKESVKYLNAVKIKLMQKYDKLLRSQNGLAEVDYSVTDAARVVRLPGTINQSNRSWCHLIDVNRGEEGEPVYFDLNDIAYGCHLFDKSSPKIVPTNSPNLFFSEKYKAPALAIRLEKLKILQSLRKEKREGYREYSCFIFYNAAKQLYGPERAKLELKGFNQGFSVPLTEQELTSATRSVDNHTGSHEDIGFYKISDKKIMQKLNITDDENQYCGFNRTKRAIMRAENKKQNAEKRANRNRQICQYVSEHEEKTYQEIAALFSISLATLKNILKKENVRRYTGASISKPQKAKKVPQYCLGISLPGHREPVAGEKSAWIPVLSDTIDAFSGLVSSCREAMPIKGQLKLNLVSDGG